MAFLPKMSRFLVLSRKIMLNMIGHVNVDYLLDSFLIHAKFLRCPIVSWLCRSTSLPSGNIRPQRAERSDVGVSAIYFQRLKNITLYFYM